MPGIHKIFKAGNAQMAGLLKILPFPYTEHGLPGKFFWPYTPHFFRMETIEACVQSLKLRVI